VKSEIQKPERKGREGFAKDAKKNVLIEKTFVPFVCFVVRF
jgi:hypothetical protein